MTGKQKWINNSLIQKYAISLIALNQFNKYITLLIRYTISLETKLILYLNQ